FSAVFSVEVLIPSAYDWGHIRSARRAAGVCVFVPPELAERFMLHAPVEPLEPPDVEELMGREKGLAVVVIGALEEFSRRVVVGCDDFNPAFSAHVAKQLAQLRGSRSHDQFCRRLAVVAECCVLPRDFANVLQLEFGATFRRFLVIDPAGPEDRQLLARILEFLSESLKDDGENVVTFSNDLLQSIAEVLVPVLQRLSASPDGPPDDSSLLLLTKSLSFLRAVIFSPLMESANFESAVAKRCCTTLSDILIWLCQQEAVPRGFRQEKGDCLDALASLTSSDRFSLALDADAATHLVGSLVHLAVWYQHEHLHASGNSAFTFRERHTYRLLALCLRNLSRSAIAEDGCERWQWGGQWLFDDELRWLMSLLHDDERDVQKHGLGILGNFVLARDSYPHVVALLPRFLDMAFSYALDHEGPEALRTEALVIINNFLIMFCHDNRLMSAATPLLLGASDGGATAPGLLAPHVSVVSDVSMTTAHEESKAEELFGIFEHSGFFEKIHEVLASAGASLATPYRCAVAELLLNLAVVSPPALCAEMAEATRGSAWGRLVELLAPVPGPRRGASVAAAAAGWRLRRRAVVEEAEWSAACTSRLRLCVLQLLRVAVQEDGGRAAALVVETTPLLARLGELFAELLLDLDREASQAADGGGSSWAAQAFLLLSELVPQLLRPLPAACVAARGLPGGTQDAALSLLLAMRVPVGGVAGLTLGHIVLSAATWAVAGAVTRIGTSRPAGRAVASWTAAAAGAADAEAAAACHLLARILTLHFGEAVELGFGATLELPLLTGGGVITEAVGPALARALASFAGMCGASVHEDDAVLAESLRLALQALLGRCAAAKAAALAEGLLDGLVARAEKGLQKRRARQSRKDVEFCLCVVRHMLAGSIECK
ncbi:hypothetical protein HK405_009882, partial [Cladochytrium tenue]